MFLYCLFLRRLPSPQPTLFPYTTLFRSEEIVRSQPELAQFDGERLANLTRKLRDLDLAHLHCQLKPVDRKSTRLNSSHVAISYAVFCLKKKTMITTIKTA